MIRPRIMLVLIEALRFVAAVIVDMFELALYILILTLVVLGSVALHGLITG